MGQLDKILDLEIKLSLPDTQGGYFTEHLPIQDSKILKKLKERYLLFRVSKNLEIYYVHVRHMFSVKQRKVYDIAFLNHLDNLGQENLNWRNKLHQRIVGYGYFKELGVIDGLYESDWRLDKSPHPQLTKDPYIKAYREKWIDSYQESGDWRALFMGVSTNDFFDMHLEDIFGKINDLIDQWDEILAITDKSQANEAKQDS